MLKDFKAFIMRGNVMDMAVGIIVGAAFTKIVTSLVEDVLMPPIGLLTGGTDFSNLFIALSPRPFETLALAKAAGVPTINYGLFLNTVIQFLIVAFAVFLLIRALSQLTPQKPKAEPEPDNKPCPHCWTTIALKATRCPSCTSELAA